MSMTAEAFEALVRRTEARAAARPLGYRLRVVGLAVLPYLYVFGALALALAGIAVLAAAAFYGGRAHGAFVKLAAKGSLALGMLVYAVGRALWLGREEPEGHRLRPSDHPQLFAEIDAVRRAVGAPPAHVVILCDDFNAAIAQHPRLGLLGWQRNYLFLGLPLMRALSPEQFRAVLAHEFGHLAGSHGRVSAWIYRSRARWSALLAMLEKDDHWASFVFRPFFRWYAPYFHAYSFVRARSNEYDADRAAADATSPRTAGDALSALAVRGPQLDREYWPAIGARMEDLPEPDLQPHASMVLGPLDPDRARAWLDARLAEPTGIADTHPSLADRLAALGVEARVPPSPEPSAAEACFGAALAQVTAPLDAAWREWIHDRWTQHYETRRAQRERLAELDAKEDTDLDTRELFERGELAEQLRGPDEALAIYRAVHARDPGHLGADFHTGRLLLERDDASGIAHIERCIEASESAILYGCELVVDFLRRSGREAEQTPWIERWQSQRAKLDEDERDRGSVWFDERYGRPDIPAAMRGEIAAFLSQHACVKRAWLLKRRTLHYPEWPMHVLVVRRKAGWLDWLGEAREKRADAALQQALVAVPGPDGDYKILVSNHLKRKIRDRLEGFDGTAIYPPS